ncbi:MAG: Mur ligase family protein [Acidobacteriota bacterium]|nr:Mur ligase family protein [Acidobacteriota bacterium]
MRLDSLPMFGMRLGLDATREVLADFGDPHRDLPTVLVAGTNGKGSTAALLASMAGAAGYRVGLYTSPHLESVRERLRIDGHAIALAELEALCDETIEAGEACLGHPPSYFETLTIAALRWFAREKVDLAVLEVGLGGRLDATNVAFPELSVITEIGLDHQEHLGATLDAIAREKAGILRPGKPALAWVSATEARRTLEAEARDLGAPLEAADDEVEIRQRRPAGWHGQEIELRTPAAEYRLRLALPGAHQSRNLGLAVRAAEYLRELGWQRLDAEAITQGTAACRWPGRLETVELGESGPTDGPGLPERVVLEAAHNADGAAALVDFLKELGEPVDLLFGALEDKAPETFLAPLAKLSRKIVLSRPPAGRGRDADELARSLPGDLLEELRREGRLVVENDAEAALDQALAHAASPTLLVTGSIYLSGRIRELLRQRTGKPPAAADLHLGGGQT